MRKQYLLWDHDGVLVDTECWYFEATRAALALLDVNLSKERYLEIMATGASCWELARARGIRDHEIRAQRRERDALYQEFLRTKPIEIEGVAEVLVELAYRYRMAIITSARRSDFDLIHEDRDLLRHFEFILTIEDYEHSKPHPDPYLAGLARFGAQPHEAVVLEDSARGLTSARAAGIACLIVRNPFTASQDFSGAWRLVDSIRDVPAMLAA
jgi:HAD superfamily hydrolase (TIGR01509 family)